jgi:hypothetical protein
MTKAQKSFRDLQFERAVNAIRDAVRVATADMDPNFAADVIDEAFHEVKHTSRKAS